MCIRDRPDALSDRDNLMCLVGGEEDDVEAARPVLDALVGTVQELSLIHI